jgi:hypothetical protein
MTNTVVPRLGQGARAEALALGVWDQFQLLGPNADLHGEERVGAQRLRTLLASRLAFALRTLRWKVMSEGVVVWNFEHRATVANYGVLRDRQIQSEASLNASSWTSFILRE